MSNRRSFLRSTGFRDLLVLSTAMVVAFLLAEATELDVVPLLLVPLVGGGGWYVARRWRELREAIEARDRTQAASLQLIEQLQPALSRVKQLSGLLPICSACKKIRDDNGYWTDVAVYIHNHSEVDFTHGICPDCQTTLYPDLGAAEFSDPSPAVGEIASGATSGKPSPPLSPAR